MMRPSLRQALSALLALGTAASYGRAQGTDPLMKLDSSSRRAVQSLIDSARAEGLPTEPVLSQAQLGIAKHAPGPTVAHVTRIVFLSLRAARASLGENATRDELTAGAAALQAGVQTTSLIDLRQASHGKPVTVPLVVLADLVSRGVRADTASRAILQLWMAGAGDADLMGLSRSVQEDILSGAAPGDALLNRVRTTLRPPPKKLPE